jgi:hypothetical protein
MSEGLTADKKKGMARRKSSTKKDSEEFEKIKEQEKLEKQKEKADKEVSFLFFVLLSTTAYL